MKYYKGHQDQMDAIRDRIDMLAAMPSTPDRDDDIEALEDDYHRVDMEIMTMEREDKREICNPFGPQSGKDRPVLRRQTYYMKPDGGFTVSSMVNIVGGFYEEGLQDFYDATTSHQNEILLRMGGHCPSKNLYSEEDLPRIIREYNEANIVLEDLNHQRRRIVCSNKFAKLHLHTKNGVVKAEEAAAKRQRIRDAKTTWRKLTDWIEEGGIEDSHDWIEIGTEMKKIRDVVEVFLEEYILEEYHDELRFTSERFVLHTSGNNWETKEETMARLVAGVENTSDAFNKKLINPLVREGKE